MRTVSTFIIALLLVGVIIGVFSLFYASVADNYTKTYNDSSLGGYDQFAALQEQAEDIDEGMTQIQSDSGVFDVIGGLLKSGYTVIKTTTKSVGIFNNMTNQAVDDAGLGANTTNMKNTMLLIVSLLFIFTIIAVLVGREI